ncbi:MAG: hypothetical protein ABWZ42_05880, partial [Ilumatobacteraceae bacterium]
VVVPPGEWPAPLFPSEARVERRSVRLRRRGAASTDLHAKFPALSGARRRRWQRVEVVRTEGVPGG